MTEIEIEADSSTTDRFLRPDDRPEAIRLLHNLKRDLPALSDLLAECDRSSYDCEDRLYRFYHQSYKVYFLQNLTEEIVPQLHQLMPERDFHPYFRQILHEGTGLTFSREHNKRWLEITRPILEAFFHARYFLEMTVKYGAELDEPPCLMPSGWAALLHLYNLR